MTAHAGERLDGRPEVGGGPLLRSLLFHAALVGTAIGLQFVPALRGTDQFGEKTPGGIGSVAVDLTPTIPLPAKEGPKNPVANDTQSQVPTKTAPEPPKREVEDPAAIALKGREDKRKQTPKPQPQSTFTPTPPAPGQMQSRTPQQVSTPVYGMPGSGGVGIGPSSPFGNRFGAYAEIIRKRVAERWQRAGLQPTARPATLTFELQRNGSATNVRITTPSGNYLLDQSALRAVLEAQPFPPLPPGFERDAAVIEFLFELKQ